MESVFRNFALGGLSKPFYKVFSEIRLSKLLPVNFEKWGVVLSSRFSV
jgi:hypothetical protein